jgi:RNA polymerase II-associated factor 1
MAMNLVCSSGYVHAIIASNTPLAIQTVPNAAPLHPADRALMRPPNALGKAAASASTASFLRRTEYTTSSFAGGSKFESSNSGNTMRVRKKRQRVDVSENDPVHIARHIIRSFDIAYPEDAHQGPDTPDAMRGAPSTVEERAAWKVPKNPRNAKLECLGAYPLLPDWDATPDTGSYMMYKFAAPPVNNPGDNTYDSRIDVGLLRPIGQTVQDQDLYLHEQEAHRQDPTLPVPIPRYHYEFFLPSDRSKVQGIKRNFTMHDPDGDDIPFDEGQDADDNPRKVFRYENTRTYEAEKQSGDVEKAYADVVAVALHDPEIHDDEPLRDTKLQKAAYFYPISQRTVIRARRAGGKHDMASEQPKADIIETLARDPDAEAEKRQAIRRRYDPIVE